MKTFKQFINEATYSSKKAEEMFSFGHCRSFAHALHSKIGGEIHQMTKDGRLYHAYVKKNGKKYDVHGERSSHSMQRTLHGSIKSDITEEPIHDSELKKIKPNMVQHAHNYIDSNKKKFDIK